MQPTLPEEGRAYYVADCNVVTNKTTVSQVPALAESRSAHASRVNHLNHRTTAQQLLACGGQCMCVKCRTTVMSAMGTAEHRACRQACHAMRCMQRECLTNSNYACKRSNMRIEALDPPTLTRCRPAMVLRHTQAQSGPQGHAVLYVYVEWMWMWGKDTTCWLCELPKPSRHAWPWPCMCLCMPSTAKGELGTCCAPNACSTCTVPNKNRTMLKCKLRPKRLLAALPTHHHVRRPNPSCIPWPCMCLLPGHVPVLVKWPSNRASYSQNSEHGA